MTYLAAMLAALCFASTLRVLRVGALAMTVVSETGTAARTMRDVHLSDEDKERRIRNAAGTLLRRFVGISARSAAALFASALLLGVFHVSGLATLAATTGFLATWRGILLASLVTMVAMARRS